MKLNKLLILIVFIYQTSLSQEPYRISFGRKDGLPSLNIYHTLSDKNGFQWFSSDLGIIKYDGYNFNLLTTEDGLADNENFRCFEDSKGRIWFNSYNGKISFFHQNTFYNESNLPLLKSNGQNGYISRISENTKGEIVIIYSKGIAKIIDLKNNKITIKNSALIVFHYIQNNKDYFITSKGISDYSLKTINQLNLKEFNTNIISRGVIKNNKFYFSHLNGIYVVENETCTKLFDIPSVMTDIIYLSIDLENKMWIGTRNGVFVKNLLSNTISFEHYYKENSISSIEIDFENRIWITTLDNGIFYIPNTTAKILKDKNNTILLTCLSKDLSNNLWGGTQNDFFYKIKNNSIESFNAKSSVISKNNISQIYFSDDTQYIIGKHAIILKNKQTKSIPFVGTKTILEDQSKNLWIGANYLLKIPKSEINKLTNDGLLSTDKRVFLIERTNSLIQNKNTIWAGTNNGIFKIVNDKIINLSKNAPQTKTIISKLYFDEQSNLLFAATNSNGLFVFQNDKLIKHFTKKNGLNSNTLYSIKKGYKTNSLLIGNNFGLNQISYKNNNFKIENLNKFIGIENLKINDTEIIDSTLYLATDEGLLYLKINSLQSSKIIPKLKIERFSVNGKNINIKSQLSFKYFENDISISFTGLSFNSQKNITYYFRLVNKKNEKWESTNIRQINYQGLEPGEYEFQIYATNASGLKSNVETIRFSIKKPFWKTNLFLIILLGMFGIALFLIWRKRLKSLNQNFERERHKIEMERDKAHLEKQMIELEQKALRMQMNPHFIFNALNTIKGYYSEGNDEKAGDYISKFSMLLRMLLENTEQSIPLATEVKMLKLYIELTQIRYKNIFDYTISIDPKINTEDTSIPTLLLQPIVENAIIHGLAPKKEQGQLNISFEKDGNALKCKVSDNGIGLKASLEKQKQRPHESKALSITKERLALIEKDKDFEVIFEINEILDQSEMSLGTEVIIQIPYKSIW